MTSRPSCFRTRRRRGVAVFWLLFVIPLLFVLLGFVLDIGKLWLAMGELQNAAEAGALAGANYWGDLGPESTAESAVRPAAILAATNFTEANLVVGQTPSVASIQLGSYAAGVFNTVIPPGVPRSQRACRVSVTMSVSPMWGLALGSKTVHAVADAKYDATNGMVQLVHVTSTIP